MRKVIRLAPMLVILVFLGYWMLQDPTRLASVTKSVGALGWDMMRNLFDGLIAFVNALFAKSSS